jgi:hypothetical protein
MQTKAARISYLAAIRQQRIDKGYQVEKHKELLIFTKKEGQPYLLEVYRGTSTNAIMCYFYNTEERMNAAIEKAKANHDRSAEYKEKRKSEQKGRVTGAAACADAIRAELKEVFNGVKFSVRSETFSMGDSVNISWNDGPTSKEVDAVTNKYQQGKFNGMKDIYENTNSRDDIPQAKYVSIHRNMSEETSATLKPIAEHIFSTFEGERPYNCWDAGQFLYRIFEHSAIQKGAKAVNIISNGNTSGHAVPENFYTIETEG